MKVFSDTRIPNNPIDISIIKGKETKLVITFIDCPIHPKTNINNDITKYFLLCK